MPINIVLVVPFTACVASFAWGMKKFFVRPPRMTPRLCIVGILGAVSALMHLAALITDSRMTAGGFAGGLSLYGLSLALFWRAVVANRGRPLAACFSESAQSHITQSGPYGLIRHPFYSSYLIALIAGFSATADFVLAPSVAVLFATYLTAARGEERAFARSALARSYADYKARTGMFVPSLGRLCLRSNRHRLGCQVTGAPPNAPAKGQIHPEPGIAQDRAGEQAVFQRL